MNSPRSSAKSRTGASVGLAVCAAVLVCGSACTGKIDVLNSNPDAGSQAPDAAGNPFPDGGGPDAGPAPDAGSSDAGAPDAGARTGIFVAVGYGGRTVRSLDDGRTWTDDLWLELNGGDDHDLLRAVAYGGDQFVAVGYRTLTSPDGKLWLDHGVMGQWLGGLAFAQGKWVATGGYGRRTQSTDGFTWMDGTFDNVTNAFRALAYDAVAARWVSVGDNGARFSTGDGTVWTAGTGGPATGLGAVASGGGFSVAVAGGQVVRSSDGGRTWTLVTTLAAGDDVAYAATQFVVVGYQHVFTSPDGLQWRDHMVPSIQGAVGCHGATCVAVSGNAAWRSPDSGETWSAAAASTASTQALIRVAWGLARGPN